jgi:acetyl esterase/lipase
MDGLPLWKGEPPGRTDESGDETPRLTPYLDPAGAAEGARPCVIVAPGGGYTKRAPYEGGPVAEWLNGLGVAAVVLHYRVAPSRYPEPLLDGARAVRLVRARAADFGIDPDRIGMLGFSAGGHVAALTAVHATAGDPGAADPVERVSSRPDAIVLCYPVITFGSHRHQGCLDNLLGRRATPELVAHLSAEKHVTADTPPAFLWHTSTDAAVPVLNSTLFAEALGRAGVPHELHVFREGKHGLGLASDVPGASQWTTLCATWLRAIGLAPAPAA